MEGVEILHLRWRRSEHTDLKTIQNYYQILEDTMLGFFLEPFHTSARKSLRLKPKFYFFDNRIARALARQLDTVPSPSTSYYGDLFEAFFYTRMRPPE